LNRIRELRRLHSMTVEKLAEALGISVPYLYDLEKERRRLNEDLIAKLCDLFGVSADYLLGRDAPAAPGAEPTWYEKPVPPLEADLEDIIRNHPNLRLFGSPLDEKTKADLLLGLRAVWQALQAVRERKAAAQGGEKDESQ